MPRSPPDETSSGDSFAIRHAAAHAANDITTCTGSQRERKEMSYVFPATRSSWATTRLVTNAVAKMDGRRRIRVRA